MKYPEQTDDTWSGLAVAASIASLTILSLCLGYAGLTLYGLAAGYALPLATVFDLAGGGLADFERLLPLIVTAIAGAGAGCAWLARLNMVSTAAVRQAELELARYWRWLSLPVIVCLFAFSLAAGGWSGNIRNTDYLYSSWAGLLPYSDASEYFAGTFHQAYSGHWLPLGTRRPLAQAFRDVIVFSAQYSYVATLLIQLVLFAMAVYVATRSVARWRGVWVGVAFFAMIYGVSRPALFTTLTEPLGLCCSLVSLTLFVEALRDASRRHALLGLGALTAALMMRMGSLVTIPFLILWIGYAFGTSVRERWRSIIVACAVVAGVLSFSTGLGFLYGDPTTTTGANFAWTLCGLATGTNWQGCQNAYAAQLANLPDELARARFLIGLSLDHMVRHPTVLLHGLVRNASAFLFYSTSLIPGRFELSAPVKAIAAVLFVPGFVSAFLIMPVRERLFWTAIVVSVVFSAAVIFADDGWRALCVTHVYMACFFAFAFTGPDVRRGESLPDPIIPASRQWRSAVAAILVIVTLFSTIPLLARAEARRESAAPSRLDAAPLVFGGRRLTGFLVVPNGSPRSVSVPTLSISEFREIVAWLGPDFGPLDDSFWGRAPFALVFGLRPDNGSGAIYVAPTQVLEQRDVKAWRFTLEGQAPWPFSIIPVGRATPVP